MEVGLTSSAPSESHELAYATPATYARVTYSRDGARASVVIPRPERRRKAAMDATGNAVGELLVCAIGAGGFLVWWSSPIWLFALVPATAALFGAIYPVAWLWSARLARPIVVEVNEREIVFSNLDERARARRVSREGMYAVYTVSHSPSIYFRRRGEDMVGLFLTPDKAESQRIADFLRDAVGLSPRVAEAGVAEVAS